MRSVAFLGAAVLLLAAAGCGGTRTVVRTVTVAPKPSATGDQRLYGRIVSLERKGNHYELRFDPAWFLSGVAANVAQAQDEGRHCRPSACPPVANDNYVVDESHRALVFLVSPKVRGTVLDKGANGLDLPGKTVTIALLAQLVAGKSPLELYEPLSSGMWILVHSDTLRAFAQQYKP
jgi:hypothetical protein